MHCISSSRINGFFIDLEMVRQNKSRCDIGIYLLYSVSYLCSVLNLLASCVSRLGLLSFVGGI